MKRVAYTDYPILALGDKSGEEAPIRKVVILAYDNDKYCRIVDCETGVEEEVKCGYLYPAPGRCGEVSPVDETFLFLLNDPWRDMS